LKPGKPNMARPTLLKRRHTELAFGWRISLLLKLTTKDSKLDSKATILK